MSADVARLFEPIRIGSLELRNRVFVSAHTTNLGRDNLATDRHVAYHRARAAGGVGLIVTEALRVHPTASARDESLGVFDDASIAPLAAVADAVHAEGAAIVGQLVHLGRQANGALARTASWGASPIPWATGAPVPHAVDAAEIATLVDAFADGARRVLAAGLDGIEVHLGHGHLLAQFLSPASNHRTDAFGGSPAARARFPREVLERVLDLAGDRPVGIRVSAEEFLEDGLRPDDVGDLVEQLTAELPLAFVDVSHSAYVGRYSLATQIADMTFDPAPFRSFPAGIKARVPHVPVFAICRLDDLETAASLVAAGEADVVGLTRAHIADPDLIAKTRSGRADEVKRCIACNQGCIGRVELSLPMSCVVNPEVGHEGGFVELTRSPHPPRARILVAGGGPAGLRAAEQAAARGHEVVLAEAGDRLGGAVRSAAAQHGRARFAALVDDLEAAVRRAGVEVRLGVRVDADLVRGGGFDAVVVATGSVPVAPPGTLDVPSALDLPLAELGERIVVVDEDGTWIGAGTALHLAVAGCEVELVGPTAGLAWNVTTYSRLSLVAQLGEAGVTVTPLRRLVAAPGDGVVHLADTVTGRAEARADVDTVIHAGPRAAVDDLAHELAAAGWGGRVVVAGDAYAPRTALEAVWEGGVAGILAGGDRNPLSTAGAPPYVTVAGEVLTATR